MTERKHIRKYYYTDGTTAIVDAVTYYFENGEATVLEKEVRHPELLFKRGEKITNRIERIEIYER